MLEGKIRDCQALVHIAGLRYGAEPDLASVPAGTPRRSYTQLEYHLGRGLARKRGDKRFRVYTFVCPDRFPYDAEPDREAPEKRVLQDAHRKSILGETDGPDAGHDRRTEDAGPGYSGTGTAVAGRARPVAPDDPWCCDPRPAGSDRNQLGCAVDHLRDCRDSEADPGPCAEFSRSSYDTSGAKDGLPRSGGFDCPAAGRSGAGEDRKAEGRRGGLLAEEDRCLHRGG